MKRIGLLGGMSWESSAEYYRLVNEATRDRLGGLHSADCVLRSVDFAEIAELQRHGAWEQAGRRLAAEAVALVAAGAELLVLCTNTMHKVADAISDAVDVPFVHIADTTAEAVGAQGLQTVGLLATAYTMEQDFYVGRLRDVHGFDVLVPAEPGSPHRPRRHLRRTLRGDRRRRLTAAVPAHHARPRRAWSARHPARLHGDRPARRSRRLARRRLRHDSAARGARRRARAHARAAGIDITEQYRYVICLWLGPSTPGSATRSRRRRWRC